MKYILNYYTVELPLIAILKNQDFFLDSVIQINCRVRN